jgi:filamentous hemagglutinin
MNKRVHRLVFDRQRGMRVPAAEHARSAGKSASGQTRAGKRTSASVLAGAALALTISAPEETDARTLGTTVQRASNLWSNRTNPTRSLPVPSATRQANNVGNFSFHDGKNGTTLGANINEALLSADPSSKYLVIKQDDKRIVIHWDSFNIGQGHAVEFIQPEAGTAHNKIGDIKPSLLLGNLKANAEVILENSNGGFFFGPTARVDTGRLVVSALSMAKALERKQTSPATVLDDYRMFGADTDTPVYTDENGQTQHKAVVVERGAEITALAGGEVIMVAPTVYNDGVIQTPEGQTILAAGQKVYLMAAAGPNTNDSAQTGLVVAVDAFRDADIAALPQGVSDEVKQGINVVEHVNKVVAERGRINLVGMAIRQNGVLSATTAVKGKNGVITLEASKTAAMGEANEQGLSKFNGSPSFFALLRPLADELGSIEFGNQSKTLVTPEEGSQTQRDSDTFLRSYISAAGADIAVKSGALIEAAAGRIDLLAATSGIASGTATSLVYNKTASIPAPVLDSSRIVVEDGATISAAGKRQVEVSGQRHQLTGRFFKSELADRTVQRDGPLYRQEVQWDARRPLAVADAKGAYNKVERTAEEWSTVGGDIRLITGGSLLVGDDAKLDVSGGSVVYTATTINTSTLRKDKQVVGIDDANGDVAYDELMSDVYGVAQRAEEQGFDAGSITVHAQDQLQLGAMNQVKADVVVGRRQRTSVTSGNSRTGNSLAALKRPDILTTSPHLYAELRPLGGVLNVGLQVDNAGNLQPVMSRITVAPTTQQDTDGALVSTANWAGTGLAQLNLNAANIDIQSGVNLELGPSGGLAALATDQLVLAGRVRAAGGEVSLSSINIANEVGKGRVVLTSTAVVDVSGQQVDDKPLGVPNSEPDHTLVVDAGNVTIEATQDLDLQAGSLVDVSAGVWRTANGDWVKGEAGAVELSLDRGKRSEGLSMRLAGQLRGYGFKQGGSLSIKGLRTLTLGTQGDNTDTASWDVTMDAEKWAQQGFGQVALSALGDVTVLENTHLAPQLTNWMTNASRPGSTQLLRTTVLQDGQRQPVSLTLSATGLGKFESLTPSERVAGLDAPGSVRVLSGAQVDVGAGGALKLEAAGSVDVAGQLLARGGTVTAQILGARGSNLQDQASSKDKAGYLPDQAVVLRDKALIDVSGVDNTYVDSDGQRQGRVLAGGTVKLNMPSKVGDGARRGKVITEVGSVIRADGVQASEGLGNGSVDTTAVSKQAGSIQMASADGIYLQGGLSAQRPDATVDGGQLYVSLSREGYNDFTLADNAQMPYPAGERALQVMSTDITSQAVADAAPGVALLSSATVQAGGFSGVHLRSEGRIVLDEGVNIQAAAGGPALRTVTLNAPVLEVKGEGTRTVQAHQVVLGDVNHAALNAELPPLDLTPVAGTTGLQVNAARIEVHGNSAIQGSGNTTLAATLGADGQTATRTDGEIMLVGRAAGSDLKMLKGSLAFDGDLTLQAGQTYATTLSDFKVEGKPDTSRLTVKLPDGGSSSQAPLSALAKLTLSAHDIAVRGVLRQPFGSITLRGQTKPELGAGSLLSVSGAGLNVPVGSTFSQTSWYYDTAGLNPDVPVQPPENASDPSNTVQALGASNLDKRILVEGVGLTIDAASAIQAQQGGELLTWEFLAGVGGNTDTLARQGVYAVLPSYRFDFAPYDTEIMRGMEKAGTSLGAGDQIDITTANGVLAAGRYTLLPARYGILPGAVMVEQVKSDNRAKIDTAIALDDGSVQVSAYLRGPGNQAALDAATGAQAPLLRWQLSPEATIRAKSNLGITSVASLLSRNATSLGQAKPTLPSDAGRVSLVSTGESFNWQANYQLDGGQLDLAMKDMVVVAAGQAAPAGTTAGAGLVVADQLTATGASSILLGGTRDGVAENTTVTTVADTLTVAANATAGEWLLASEQTLQVNDNVTLRSAGVDDQRSNRIQFKGVGNALVLTQRSDTDITREVSNASAQDQAAARLNLAAGVQLQGRAAQMDTTGQIDRASSAIITTDALGIGVELMYLGEGTAPIGALALTASDLARERVALRSYQRFDIDGSQMLGSGALQQLTIDTPLLAGLGTAGDIVTINAQEVVLRNTTGVQADASEQGQSRLLINTRPAVKDATAVGITLGEGQQRWAFASSKLVTSGDVVIDGKGSTQTQGDTQIVAARLTGTSGADHTLALDQGQFTMSRFAQENPGEQERTLNNVVGVGARFTAKASHIVQDGTIDLPSGQISLQAQGSSAAIDDALGSADSPAAAVVFTEASRTLARGHEVMHKGKKVAVAPGGTVEAVAEKGWIDLRGEVNVSVAYASDVSQVGVAAGDIRFTATDTAGGGLIIRDTAKLDGRVGQPASGTNPLQTAAFSGSLKVDVAQLALSDAQASASTNTSAIDAVASKAMAGGMHREMDVRVRQGDLVLSTSLEVGRLVMSADAGAITLNNGANIETRQAAVRGGVVQLSARDDVTLNQGARINVAANAQAPGSAGANGGDVLLASSTGLVKLQTGSTVIAGEADSATGLVTQGRVVLRAGLSAATTADAVDEQTSVKAQVAAGSVQAGQVLLEAVQLDDRGSANVTLDTTTRAQYVARADELAAQSARLSAESGLLGVENATVRYGAELRTTGSAVLDSDWNLYRNGGANPLNLTVRAGQNLTLNGNLSDGFTTATRSTSTTPTPMGTGEGGSFRLVAGADTQSAHALATQQDNTGHLTVAGDKLVRTTSGSIEMAASGNINLATPKADGSIDPAAAQAAVYVAGKTANAVSDETSTPATRSAWQRFTQQGGRLEVTAGGNIQAPAAIQGIGNWFLHTGRNASLIAWATDFDAFRQGLGSMGGGAVRVVAGGNLSNIHVAAPTSARTFANAEGQSVQAIENGGDVWVSAGQNIQGGQFFLGRGQGVIQAGESITTGLIRNGTSSSPGNSTFASAPILALMDGQWRMQSGKELNLSFAYNPTTVNSASESTTTTAKVRRTPPTAGSYLTYGDQAAVAISSLTGNVSWQYSNLTAQRYNQLQNPLSTVFNPASDQIFIGANETSALQIAPPTLEAVAHSQNVTLDIEAVGMLMAPSATGNLRIHSAADATLAGSKNIQMLDIDLSGPTPVTGTVRLPVANSSLNFGTDRFTSVADGTHVNDGSPATVTAGGDITFASGASLLMPKQVYVSAGRDLISPAVSATHQLSTDVSTLEAGRNILGFTNPAGIARDGGRIQLNGPGELQVLAGRTLNLSTSYGIESTGENARLTVASATNRRVDVDQIASTYLAGEGTDAQAARQALVAYIEDTLKVQGVSADQALAYFRNMTPDHQVAFVDQQILLPRFVQRFLVTDSQNADLPWVWTARSAGVDASDTSSALYQAYVSAKSSLVSYVQDTTKRSGLTFETALDLYRKELTSVQRSTFIDKRQIDPNIAMGLLAAQPMDKYAKYWQNLVAAQPEGKRVALDDYSSDLFRRFSQQVVLEEVRRTGSVATAVADSANVLFNPRREQVRNALWQNVADMATLAGLNEGFEVAGGIDLSRSKVHALGGGSLASNPSSTAVTDAFLPDLGGINLITAGGGITVGAETASANDLAQAATRGLAAYSGGTIQSFTKDDFQVGAQKVHIVGSGNMTLYSAAGNIDSGRGSNTAVTVPPQQAVDDGYGVYRWQAANTTTGSGLAIFEDAAGMRDGTIGLFAPKGEVRALDAFIDAPNIDLAGTVKGGDNLKGQTSGESAPPAVSVNLAVNSGLGTESAATSAQASMAKQSDAPKERSSFLTVDVLSLGDEAQAGQPATAKTCPANDLSCKKP